MGHHGTKHGGDKLAEAWAKLRRAEDYANGLDRDISAYENDPDTVAYKIDHESAQQLIRARIAHPPPLVDWGLRIGDCVHNARTALDYVAWQLAETHSPTRPMPDKNTMFLITDTAPAVSARVPSRLKWIEPSARAAIQAANPHATTNPHGKFIGLLDALDIADKHKLLTLTVVHAEGAGLGFPPALRLQHKIIVHRVYDKPFEDDAIVFTIKDPDADVYPKLVIKVAFGGGTADGEWVVPTLRGIIQAVRATIPTFKTYL